VLTLPEVKQWLRLEESDTTEDALLQSLISAADEYIKNAIPSWVDRTTNPLAKLLAHVLIADWYEHREAVGQVRDEMRLTVRSIMTQLQYSYPPPEEEGGTDA